VPILEEAIFGAFAEVQRATAEVIGNVREGWQNYFALQQIRRENEDLKQRVAQLEIRMQTERAQAQQTRTLQELLSLRETLAPPTAAANVIGASADATSGRCRSTRERRTPASGHGGGRAGGRGRAHHPPDQPRREGATAH
jgi:cell shape-determining protein MreC